MTPITVRNTQKEKQRDIKYYIKEKEWWLVQHFIFSGKFIANTFTKEIH
jgi:hypothetical protein